MSIRALLDRVVDANEAYRNGQPVMSDAEYDTLEAQLADLVVEADPNDPDAAEAAAFLADIGAPPADDSKWPKVRHRAPMTSLNKAQPSEDKTLRYKDLRSWEASCGKVGKYVVSDKCDGISISLWYEQGTLVKAVTRGDGEVGEDITRNVEKMKGVVHFIKGYDGESRGEIVLLKSDWKRHFPTYSNPRNAAAGIAKRLDGVGCEHLTVLHYQMIRSTGSPITRKSLEFRALAAVGCSVPNWIACDTLADVEAVYEEYVASRRAALDYDIDGLVIEHDDLSVMENLGVLNKRPKGAIAFKFPHDQKVTILRNVRWQVGKSGRITPVAEFDEVDLAGVKVKQASLHNVARVRHLRLFVGCSILVSRRNDVIPMVEANLDEGTRV